MGERKLNVFGLRTPVIEAGDPDAREAIVCLHGHPGSSNDWRDMLERFGELGRAVAFDMPGFGRAEKPRAWEYSVGANAVFVGGALRELGIERAHLVMHDFGGPWGLIWGLAHPEAWASSVLVDIGVMVGYRWHPIARMYRTPGLGRLMALGSSRWAFRRIMKYYNPQPRPLPPAFVDRVYDEYDYGTRRTILQLYRNAPADAMEAMVPAFREVAPPTLVVWGAHDVGAPVEQAERQRLSFPDAEIVVLPESGHWPFVDDPDRFAAAVMPFLERQLAASRDRVTAATSA